MNYECFKMTDYLLLLFIEKHEVKKNDLASEFSKIHHFPIRTFQRTVKKLNQSEHLIKLTIRPIITNGEVSSINQYYALTNKGKQFLKDYSALIAATSK